MRLPFAMTMFLPHVWKTTLLRAEVNQAVVIFLDKMPQVYSYIISTSNFMSTTLSTGGGFTTMRNMQTLSEDLIVLSDQMIDREERILAVRALRKAIQQFWDPKILQGVLWWKLSTHPYHHDDEPFALLIGNRQPVLDLLQQELVMLQNQYFCLVKKHGC